MVRGGKRVGAGRKSGSGKYGESTIPVRVPESRVEDVRAFLEQTAAATYSLPVFTSRVQAGDPSPADDHADLHLNLNDHLVRNPDSTFCVRVAGESMRDAGIFDGDLLVVDRALPATNGKVVVAVVDGALTVKRLESKSGKLRLLPENSDFTPIEIGEDTAFSIWGVVTSVIHQV